MRFFRVFATTAFCILLFITANNVILESDKNDSLGAVLGDTIIMMFFFIAFTLPVIFVLTVANYILDRLGERRIWPYVLLWTVPAGIFALETPVALPIAALTGAIYWVLTGRVAGKPGFSPKHFMAHRLLIKYAAYAAGAFIAFVVLGWLFMG